ncbi:MAG: C10 family peptidase [bacterium]
MAKNFVTQYVKGADQHTAAVVYTHPMPKSGVAAMYAVNVGSAFVLVSADDVAHPVLGYSLSRLWPTNETISEKGEARNASIVLPPQIAGYLDDLAGQIESAAGQQGVSDQDISSEWRQLLTTSLSPATTNPPDSVGPLLTTTWDQGRYYNALCPEDAAGPNGHVWGGCVATAIAQIINYWGYPEHGRGTHSYQSNYGTLSVNYDSATFDYTNMPTGLFPTSTPAQLNAVATLIYHCGVAVNMYYHPEESGAYHQDARAALINFFRFSPNIGYAEKEFFSNADWVQLLRNTIDASQPIYYGGTGTGGHAFVCDGYKTDDYFHFNFGWSGYADGWYLTDAVNPGGYDFNSNQMALVGIVPDSTGNVILGQTDGSSTFTVDEPLEFYHLLGNNAYSGTNYSNSCNNTVYFISADSANQLAADIIEFEDQNISINDGNGTWLRSLYGGGENDFSPVVSSYNALSINYSGNFYYAGFQLAISQDNGCRMVS